ncbi:hypothetical protein GCM10027259_52420 [Micromonospora palomenae]|uniref:DoxX family protein n=1 Tax=Micromonospora palomenae TaxID=1461247 RepID=UPI0014796B6C|nr:DoxX family protein [Micromonospora palomenae]
MFTAVGLFHLGRSTQVAAIARRTGHSLRTYQLIGLVEAAGGPGLLLGLGVTPLGIAAGFGLTRFMTGAVIKHLRVGDGLKQWPASAILAALTTHCSLRVSAR